MVIFYYVAQLGSFSRAAETLAVSKSFISKHITKLEVDLKVRLINRTTRQLSLTEAGEAFYQHCQSLSEIAEQGYEAILALRKQPAGTIKISVPPALAVHLLADVIVEYNQLYPDVKFNIILESRIVDIIQGGYDLALRSALLPDSTLIGQKIAMVRYVLCATPSYLKKHKEIKHPNQLTEHIFGTLSGNRSAKQLTFHKKNEQFLVHINSHFQSSNLDLIMQFVMENACMAIFPEFMVKSLVEKKKLISCLPEFKLPENPLYVVYPERALVPLKVKTFIEVLRRHLKMEKKL